MGNEYGNTVCVLYEHVRVVCARVRVSECVCTSVNVCGHLVRMSVWVCEPMCDYVNACVREQVRMNASV